MRVLLVEDDKTSLELLGRIIKSEARHSVVQAQNGEEAWGLLADPSSAFDVGIFDIHMPKMDGLVLLEKVRADDRLKPLTVMVCSSAADRRTVRRVAALGVTQYIAKPFKCATILAKLQQVENEIAEKGLIDSPKMACALPGADGDSI